MSESSTQMLPKYHKLNMVSYLNINMSKTVAPSVFHISVDVINCVSENLSLMNFPHLSSAIVTCNQSPSPVDLWLKTCKSSHFYIAITISCLST